MSYVETILQPGETVVHRGRPHWIVYGYALLAGLGSVLVLANGGASGAMGTLALVLLALAGGLAIRAFITQLGTEIAVTNRRVILKTGLIGRTTAEMNLHQVESVEVIQSVLGRVLNYGQVHIHGTGEGLEAIDAVADPLTFRSSITAR